MQERLRRQRRRLVMGMGVAFLGGLGAGAGTVAWLARGTSTRVHEEADELVWIRSLATGSLQRLVRQAYGFLATADGYPDDPVVQQGLHRLGLYCLGTRGSETDRLARRLLSALRGRGGSTYLRELIPALERRLR